MPSGGRSSGGMRVSHMAQRDDQRSLLKVHLWHAHSVGPLLPPPPPPPTPPSVAAAAEAYVALDICAGTVRDICADTGTVRDMYAVTFREPDCTVGVAVAPVIQAK